MNAFILAAFLYTPLPSIDAPIYCVNTRTQDISLCHAGRLV